MLQFFAFFCHFKDFYWTGLKLRLVKVDKGLLQDVITFYGHFKSYMFCYSKQKHPNFY